MLYLCQVSLLDWSLMESFWIIITQSNVVKFDHFKSSVEPVAKVL